VAERAVATAHPVLAATEAERLRRIPRTQLLPPQPPDGQP
jgi:hypothetical protein